jgi:predicted O-methyltransferase YrrM
MFCFLFFISYLHYWKNEFKYIKKTTIYLDKFETHIFNNIKDKLDKYRCSRMWNNQREFLNGVIRKFRPKKIVEIGVAYGGGSAIILNAIKDIKNSHLYSIDLSSPEKTGNCLRNYFPEYLKNWSLYTGNIAANFIEEIGDNIDMVFIDSAHFEPGEILDFLVILPFVKEEAIIGFHDIGNQITSGWEKNKRKEWAPYLIFNIIKGQKFLPSGKNILTQDIGVIKLERNQKKYIHDYFRALGGQWQYFPKEKHIKIIKSLFNKYYDDECLTIFNETVEFNRKFTKNNPMENLYKENSD